jgi:hypothetical protein
LKLANKAKLGRQCLKETEKKTENGQKMAEKKAEKQGGMKRPFLYTTPRISHEQWPKMALNSLKNETKMAFLKQKAR